MGPAVVGRAQPYDLVMGQNCSISTAMLQKCSDSTGVTIVYHLYNCLPGK